jgi:hypothetical protein
MQFIGKSKFLCMLGRDDSPEIGMVSSESLPDDDALISIEYTRGDLCVGFSGVESLDMFLVEDLTVRMLSLPCESDPP